MRGTACGLKSASNGDRLGLAPTSRVMANAYDVPRQEPVRASRERRGATPNGKAMVFRSALGASLATSRCNFTNSSATPASGKVARLAWSRVWLPS